MKQMMDTGTPGHRDCFEFIQEILKGQLFAELCSGSPGWSAIPQQDQSPISQ